MSVAASPVVVEVLRFDDLPLGSLASHRAVVRWSDGTEGECLRWHSDEVLVCEGDLLGKTQEQLRSLHLRRDRDWLRSQRISQRFADDWLASSSSMVWQPTILRVRTFHVCAPPSRATDHRDR